MGSQQCWNCLMMRSLPGLLVLTAFCAFYQSVKILPHRLFYLYFSVEPKYSSMLLLLVAACCGVLLWGWLVASLVCCAGQGWGRQGCTGLWALQLWAQVGKGLIPSAPTSLSCLHTVVVVCVALPGSSLGLGSTMTAFLLSLCL